MSVLFFDFDGTLYINGAISEKCLAELRRVKEQGHFLVLNTGRGRGFIPKGYASLPLWDGMICGSSYIEWQGKLLQKAVLPRDTIIKVCAFAEERGINVYFEGVKESYSVNGALPDMREALSAGELPEISKVSFWCPPENVPPKDFPELHIIHLRDYAEGVLPGCSKSTGMAALLEKAGLSGEETWAFGDSENDREMLMAASRGVCMPASPGDFDDFCFYRCEQTDGVPEALARFF